MKKNLLIMLSSALLMLMACGESNEPCVDTNCSDYPSQEAAQRDFNANPECRGDLDADNDGIACENL